jgi:hypothetical protein
MIIVFALAFVAVARFSRTLRANAASFAPAVRFDPSRELDGLFHQSVFTRPS